MTIKKDYGFYDLKDEVWEGAVDTLDKIENEGKQDELMEFLESYFVDVPTMTEVNDLLWFENDFVFESLGMEVEE